MSAFEYLRDGPEIYRRSFATIRAEAELTRFSPIEARVAERVIHACGMVDIAPDLVFSPSFAAAAQTALESGAAILTDSRMAAAGIIRTRLSAGNVVLCTLDAPGVAEDAARVGTTRSAAALDRWGEKMAGALVVIGNAPTALFRLLELLDEGAPQPAAIIGVPVGFVGAEESKEALRECTHVPYFTVRGRRGGSAIAAAAVNALSGPNA